MNRSFTWSLKESCLLLALSTLTVIFVHLNEPLRHFIACAGLAHASMWNILTMKLPYRFIGIAIAVGLGVYSYKIIKRPSIETSHATTRSSDNFNTAPLPTEQPSTLSDTDNKRTLDALRKIINTHAQETETRV